MSKFIYTKENPLRVCTLCSGYESQKMALDELGIPNDLVVWSEIDRWAIQAHNAVYPECADRNAGDMTGKKLYRLTFLEYAGLNESRNSRWKVRCDCGIEFEVTATSVTHGSTRSCGCLRIENNKNRHKH